jgi:hypothetical protein
VRLPPSPPPALSWKRHSAPLKFYVLIVSGSSERFKRKALLFFVAKLCLVGARLLFKLPEEVPAVY